MEPRTGEEVELRHEFGATEHQSLARELTLLLLLSVVLGAVVGVQNVFGGMLRLSDPVGLAYGAFMIVLAACVAGGGSRYVPTMIRSERLLPGEIRVRWFWKARQMQLSSSVVLDVRKHRIPWLRFIRIFDKDQCESIRMWALTNDEATLVAEYVRQSGGVIRTAASSG
jgi:hypothetical protein